MENRECPTVLADPRNGTPLRLVWHDEFDGNAPDPEKWNQFNRMWGGSDGRRRIITTKSDPRNLSVEHGKLVMRAWREPDADGLAVYSTHETLTTWNRMSFRYGYLEINAIVPFSRGAFPAFWLQSAWQHRSVDYMTEVDVFEVYKAGYVESTLHKWYLKDPVTGPHTRHDWNTPLSYTFPEDHWESLSHEYHRWGFLWIPEKIAITLDGNIIATYDITDAGDFQEGLRTGDDLTGMGGFQDPMIINFTNWVGSGFRDKSWVVGEDTELPLTFRVDWIRLYQTPGMGDLFDDRP